MTQTKTIFAKIIDRELPAKIIYEDDLCLVFPDINPVAPVHVLIVPKKPLINLDDAKPEDQALLGHLLLVGQKMARQLNIHTGFRLGLNNGAPAGQTVFHLHLHLIGGFKSRPTGEI